MADGSHDKVVGSHGMEDESRYKADVCHGMVVESRGMVVDID